MAQFIIPVLISVALSLLAAYLMRPDMENPVQDEKPSTVASRGSYIPRLFGVRRTGPIVGWVGKHKTTKEGGSSTKGSGSKQGQVKIHREAGWHILCVGPAYGLHQIIESGKVIWRGPIYRHDTPSGSLIGTGKRGRFRIYWGETGQPIDPVLDDANKVGIASRWEHLCYVVWDRKRLGTGRVWPMIDYVVEVRPESSQLTQSTDWIPEGTELGDTPRDIHSIYGVGGPFGDNYIEVRNKRDDEFYTGVVFQMDGNAQNPDGLYTCLSSVWSGAWGVLRIYTAETLTDDIRKNSFPEHRPDGTITAYTLDARSGVNPAHMIYELIFSPFPLGLGYSTDLFNLDSLEALGVLLSQQTDQERYMGHYLAERGEDTLGALAAIMQDVGVFLRFNIKNGLYEFIAIRAPSVTPPHLDEDSLVSPLPEVETLHGSRQRSRMMFAFKDRLKNYRANTVNRDNDALAEDRNHVKVVQVPVPTVVQYETAVQVANRRSQEEFGNFAAFKVITNKESRALLPGDNLTVQGFDPVMRVLDVKLEPLASRVELHCIVDFYGIAKSTFEDQTGGGEDVDDTSPGQTPFKITEVPSFLKSSANLDVIASYFRDTSSVNAGIVHLSPDDITYQLVHSEQGLHTGGELREAIDIDAETYLDQGPQFELIGPDIDEVEDLTGDDTNWRLGRQLAIINDEIFYIKKVTAIAAGIYRADGLIRARYDTVKQAHTAGDYIYIFSQRNIEWFDDILLVPDTTVYAKVQQEGTDSLELTDIYPETLTLHGKGVKPMDPRNLRTVNMRNDYKTGEDVPLKWAYLSAAFLNSGAGLQGGGFPHATPPVPGEFVIRFRTTGDVLQKELNIADPEYTLTNANMILWYGSEQASFKVAVALVNAGFESREIEITITRV
jgi:hypothetical protein